MELANGNENIFFSLNNTNKYCIEDFDITGTQGLNNVLLIANEIKEGSTVLDVGCSYGKIGKELTDKKCTIFGIEIDSVAAKLAKSNGYKDVFLYNIEDFNSAEYKRMYETIEKVDVVIFSDVFEHLIDPTKVLIEYSKLLKNEGIILISVPNIAHMDIILHLLDDEFNYSEMGILDNTHLKFFTKKSFVQWINLINSNYNDIKFDCEYLGATFYNNQYMGKIKIEYPKLFNVLSQNSNYNGLQIIFKLKRIDESQNPVNLIELLNDKEIQLTKLLGDIVEEREISIDLLPNMNYGEKLWLKQRINELNDRVEWYQKQDIERQKYIEEQLKGLEWYQKQDEERQNYIDGLGKQIEEQKKGLEWHQEQDEERKNYIIELEKQIDEQKKGLEWHQGQDEERQTYIEELGKQIEEQKNGLEWHQRQDKDRQTYIEVLEKQIEEQKNGLEWHQKQDKELHEYITSIEKNLENEKNKNNELQSKLFTLENSVSWKVTKFLR